MTTDGEGTQSGAEGSQGGTGADTSGQNTGGTDTTTGTTTGTQSGTQTTAEDTELRAQAEAYRERMRAADQRAAKFEQELKQLRDKDLPEAEKMQRDLSDAQTRAEKAEETVRTLSLKVAFLSDNSVTWHNPEEALRLADLSGVEIGADQSVTGLKDALTALAKRSPYLVKTETTKPEGEGAGNTQPPNTSAGNNGASGTGKTGAKALTSRFPALSTRVRR